MAFSTSQPIISRPFPSAVIYDLSEPYQTTITLPSGSTWSSGLHWHESHAETLLVVQGAVQVFLEGRTQIVRAQKSSPASGQGDRVTVRIPRYALHEWKRVVLTPGIDESDSVDDADREDAIVVERTDPRDIEKSIFFWNLNGAILLAESSRALYKVSEERRASVVVSAVSSKLRLAILDIWLNLSLMIIFRELDNFPVLVNGHFPFQWSGIGKRLNLVITHITLELARVAGVLCGIRSVRKEFTPPQLWEARFSKHQDTSQKNE
ncbi:hypothetical protein EV356DRAFT_448497 [Viridothelium virens]|uniref:Uncharacterized protein n=1 Tax=Viridothelium virens TaxID=1048519 RepID=A0A6A6H6C2_VIRVR|nr:hypothetical protein EV356DRAFT_448497 [Viridothelium virens]